MTRRDTDAATIHELLLADHDEIRRLATEFYDAVCAGNWDQSDKLFERMEDVTEKHMLFEEEEVFPVFDQHAAVFSCSGSSTMAMRSEHASIRATLSEVGVGLQLHQVREASIRRLVASIDAHAAQEDIWARQLADCMHKADNVPSGIMDRLRALLPLIRP